MSYAMAIISILTNIPEAVGHQHLVDFLLDRGMRHTFVTRAQPAGHPSSTLGISRPIVNMLLLILTNNVWHIQQASYLILVRTLTPGE